MKKYNFIAAFVFASCVFGANAMGTDTKKESNFLKKIGTSSVTIECVVRSKEIDHDDTLRIILNCDLVFVKIDKLGRPVAHHYMNPS